MLDFKMLERFREETSDLSFSEAKNLINHKQETAKNKWMLNRFLDGYHNRLGMIDSDEITIIPTSKTIDYSVLDVCRQGIEFFLNQTSIEMNVKIVDPIEMISNYIHERTYESNIGKILPVGDFHAFVYLRVKREIFPMKYTCFVDNSDFFSTEAYAAGKTFIKGNITTLLERGITKGRILDDAYLRMTQEDKIDYMKLVAAHETYHLIGKLNDLEKQSHEERGLAEEPYCLGYSKFKIPPHICTGCEDSISSLWYGYKARKMDSNV